MTEAPAVAVVVEDEEEVIEEGTVGPPLPSAGALLEEIQKGARLTMAEIDGLFKQFKVQRAAVDDRKSEFVTAYETPTNTKYDRTDSNARSSSSTTDLLDTGGALHAHLHAGYRNQKLWAANVAILQSKATQWTPVLVHESVGEPLGIGLTIDNPALPPNRTPLDGLEALRLPLFPAADVAPLPPKKKKPKKGKGKAATTEEEGEGEEDEDSSDSGLDSADDDSEDES